MFCTKGNLLRLAEHVRCLRGDGPLADFLTANEGAEVGTHRWRARLVLGSGPHRPAEAGMPLTVRIHDTWKRSYRERDCGCSFVGGCVYPGMLDLIVARSWDHWAVSSLCLDGGDNDNGNIAWDVLLAQLNPESAASRRNALLALVCRMRLSAPLVKEILSHGTLQLCMRPAPADAFEWI